MSSPPQPCSCETLHCHVMSSPKESHSIHWTHHGDTFVRWHIISTCYSHHDSQIRLLIFRMLTSYMNVVPVLSNHLRFGETMPLLPGFKHLPTNPQSPNLFLSRDEARSSQTKTYGLIKGNNKFKVIKTSRVKFIHLFQRITNFEKLWDRNMC